MIQHGLSSPKIKNKEGREREGEREKERGDLKVKVHSSNIAALIRYKYYDTS